MSLPSIADQIGLAVGVARREARIEARRQAPRQPQPPKPRRHVIPPRTRILLALGDGRPHRWGELIETSGCPSSSAAWALAALIRAGRVERLGRRRPHRYRLT